MSFREVFVCESTNVNISRFKNSDEYYMDVNTTSLEKMLKDKLFNKVISILFKTKNFYSDINDEYLRIDDGIVVDGKKITNIYFKNKNVKNEVVNILIHQNLEYGIRKIYGDISMTKIKNTKEYKQNANLVDKIK